jgi:hypothetical protein
MGEMRRIFTEVTGSPTPFFRMPRWLLRLVNPDIARQLAWNNTVSWEFHVPEAGLFIRE